MTPESDPVRFFLLNVRSDRPSVMSQRRLFSGMDQFAQVENLVSLPPRHDTRETTKDTVVAALCLKQYNLLD